MSAAAKKGVRLKAQRDKDAKEAEARERQAAQALRPVVRDVLSTKKMPWPEKEDRIAHALRSMLGKVGRFYRTVEGVPLFFRTADRKVYEISGRAETDFGRYVTYLCDFSVRVPPLFRSIDRVRAVVAQSAPIVQLHGLAHNTAGLDVVAVNDFGGGMWFRKRGGKWMWRPNGYEGILFWTPSGIVEPWEPEFGFDWLEDSKYLDWLIHQAHFAEHVLTIHDQRMLMRALVLAPFFPALGKNRPIHAHLGLDDRRQHDTGKTTTGKMLGLVFVGSKFEPLPPPEGNEKGQEALALELAHKPFVLLDNVDTDIKWLNDFLCTYCTGAAPSKRKLYTDTQQVTIEYRGRLIITSRKPSFKRPDTASRTIPFRFEPIAPEERKTEWELLTPITERRGKVWAGVLAASAASRTSSLS